MPTKTMTSQTLRAHCRLLQRHCHPEHSVHEETQVLAQGLLFPFVSAELIPLVDADTAKQLVRQMISAMARA